MAKFTRRDMLIGGAAALAAPTLPAVALSTSITDSLSLNNTKRRQFDGNDHDKRWHNDLLQRLGPEERPAHCVSPRLASVVGRLGRADALLPCQRLSRRCARLARSRSLLAGGRWARHGPLCVRCLGGGRASRPEKC